MGPQIRKSFSLRNNEMVVDMPSVTAGLPHSIEAVFYVAGGSAEKEAEARDVWTRFMEVYGLSEVCACVRWRLGCVCACYVCACYVCACECCVPAWVCACVRVYVRVCVHTRANAGKRGSAFPTRVCDDAYAYACLSDQRAAADQARHE